MMKMLLATELSATAITIPLVASVDSMPKAEQSAAQPEKAKGIWIDVHSAEEFNDGYLHSAVNIPHGQIVEPIKVVSSDKDAQINLYCLPGRWTEIVLTWPKKIAILM